MLLQNILPQHVADVHLTNTREAGKLFCESYKNAAVMFASLPQFTSFFADEDTTKPLNILHDIISKFDQLMYEAQFNRIEKIKIIQSTFMAACGLLSGRKLSLEYGENGWEEASKAQNAKAMAKYAAAMMRSLKEMDYDKFDLRKRPDFQLRVGISTGKVIAGVVGAQKPLYDIWGDTVNVAARMDYTGEEGMIHVPEATARELMNLAAAENDQDQLLLDPWVVCTCRGWRPVKGKGEMLTYYVDLTDELFLVEKRRHGDEDEDEDEDEQQWEDLRVDQKWMNKKAEAEFTWPVAGNRKGPEKDAEEVRAGSGSSAGQESTASTLPCHQQGEEWKLEENSEEEEEEEEEEGRRQSQSSCPSTTTSSVLVAAPGRLGEDEVVDEDVARDRSEEMSDVESDGEDSVARLRAWLDMHRR